jgi:hypothetical protein
MLKGGDWPPADDELVTTYLNTFTRFITSTDFQKLQQTIRDHSAFSDIRDQSASVKSIQIYKLQVVNSKQQLSKVN